MGGYGSTRWRQHYKKITVEACLRFSVRDIVGTRIPRDALTKACYAADSTSMTWTRGGQPAGWINISFANVDGRTPRLILRYSVGGQPIRSLVALEPQECYLGGVRWWYTCPLCARRAGVLYLPPTGALRFACRTCHNLTYTSAQTAHECDRGIMADIKVAVDHVLRMEKLEARLARTRGTSKKARYLAAKLAALLEAGRFAR